MQNHDSRSALIGGGYIHVCMNTSYIATHFIMNNIYRKINHMYHNICAIYRNFIIFAGQITSISLFLRGVLLN